MIKLVSKTSKYKGICECLECGEHYEVNFYAARKSRLGHLCSVCKTPANQELNQKLLHKHFSYDEDSGLFICRLPQHQLEVGDEPGWINNTGYRCMSIGSKQYLVHRLIWLYMKGYLPEQVDHINHNKLDNSWNNLREVTNIVNSMNCKLSINNSTRVNGVSLIPVTGKYRAYINRNYKQIHLGVYDTIEEAYLARKQANAIYKYHCNHGIGSK